LSRWYAAARLLRSLRQQDVFRLVDPCSQVSRTATVWVHELHRPPVRGANGGRRRALRQTQHLQRLIGAQALPFRHDSRGLSAIADMRQVVFKHNGSTTRQLLIRSELTILGGSEIGIRKRLSIQACQDRTPRRWSRQHPAVDIVAKRSVRGVPSDLRIIPNTVAVASVPPGPTADWLANARREPGDPSRSGCCLEAYSNAISDLEASRIEWEKQFAAGQGQSVEAERAMPWLWPTPWLN
jgi:hypothetical protein